MRNIVFLLLLGALVSLTGCAAEMGMFLNPPHAYINAPTGRWISSWSTPRVEYADMNGGWIRIWGSHFDIPGDRPSQRFKLIPGGRTVFGHVEYDGRIIHRFGNRGWIFPVTNYGDGGNHELRIPFVIQEPGQPAIPDTMSYLIYNGYGGW